MTENVINGKTLGGTRTFGYRTVNGRYTVDEEEAKIVRKIFELYTQTSLTCKGVKKRLDQLKITRPDGRTFKPSSIYNIVKNPRYAGILSFRGQVNLNAIPRIIDNETFQLAKEKLRQNQKYTGTHTANKQYLLFGKCVCGYCGQIVRSTGGTSSHHKRYYSYYKCRNAAKNKKCEGKSIGKEFFEGFVAEAIKEFLEDNQNLENISQALYENQLQDSPYRIALEKEKEESRKKMENIMLAIEQGAPYAEFNSRYKELQTRVAEINHDLDKDKAENPIFDKNDILATFKALRKMEMMTEEGKAILFRTFINQVILFNDRIEIVLNYKHSKNINSVDILCPKGSTYSTPAPANYLYSELHAIGENVVITVELTKDSVTEWRNKLKQNP